MVKWQSWPVKPEGVGSSPIGPASKQKGVGHQWLAPFSLSSKTWGRDWSDGFGDLEK
jgi:hypothetical protein